MVGFAWEIPRAEAVEGGGPVLELGLRPGSGQSTPLPYPGPGPESELVERLWPLIQSKLCLLLGGHWSRLPDPLWIQREYFFPLGGRQQEGWREGICLQRHELCGDPRDGVYKKDGGGSTRLSVCA